MKRSERMTAPGLGVARPSPRGLRTLAAAKGRPETGLLRKVAKEEDVARGDDGWRARRRELLGLVAFLGASGLDRGISQAGEVPTVEEMLKRSKENRVKNDNERYAKGEANYMRSQFQDDWKRQKAAFEADMLQMEKAPVTTSPETVSEEVAPVAEEGTLAEIAKEPSLEEETIPSADPVVEETVAAPSPDPVVSEESTGNPSADAFSEPGPTTSEAPDLVADPAETEMAVEISLPEPEPWHIPQPAALASTLTDAEVLGFKDGVEAEAGEQEEKVVQATVAIVGGGLVLGAASFLRTLLQSGKEDQLRRKARERHENFVKSQVEEEAEATTEVVAAEEEQPEEEEAAEVIAMDEQEPEEAEAAEVIAMDEQEPEEAEAAEVIAAEEEQPEEEEAAEVIAMDEQEPEEAEAAEVIAMDEQEPEEAEAAEVIAMDEQEPEELIVVEEVEEEEIEEVLTLAFKSNFVLKQRELTPKVWPRKTKSVPESFVLNQRKIMAKLSALEEKALKIQYSTSLENTTGRLLSDVSSFDKRSLELQYTTSSMETRRKLLSDISDLEKRALALQYTESAEATQRKLLSEITAAEKTALALQYTASAEVIQRKTLQDLSSLEKNALELQYTKSAEETRRKSLQDLSPLEETALEKQVEEVSLSTRAAKEIGEIISLKMMRRSLATVSSEEQSALQTQYERSAVAKTAASASKQMEKASLLVATMRMTVMILSQLSKTIKAIASGLGTTLQSLFATCRKKISSWRRGSPSLKM